MALLNEYMFRDKTCWFSARKYWGKKKVYFCTVCKTDCGGGGSRSGGRAVPITAYTIIFIGDIGLLTDSARLCDVHATRVNDPNRGAIIIIYLGKSARAIVRRRRPVFRAK